MYTVKLVGLKSMRIIHNSDPSTSSPIDCNKFDGEDAECNSPGLQVGHVSLIRSQLDR